MSLAGLTRFPGRDIPAAALTGNPVLDDFLTALDRELLGSARVRLQTVAEIRDHLLERKASFEKVGGTEAEAAEKAVQSIGTPDELAGPQRHTLKKKFLRASVPTGGMFGLGMGMFFYLMEHGKDLGPVFFAVLGLCQGVGFGLFMGWFMTFILPDRLLTVTFKQDMFQDMEGDFTVHYSTAIRRMSYFLMVFFALTACTCLIFVIAGFLHPSLNRSLSFLWWCALTDGMFSALLLHYARLALREYKVDEDGILVKECIGRKKAFAWQDFQRVGLLGKIRPWVPYSWKKVKFAEFQKDGCKPVRMLIYPDMVNADRLFVLLDQKFQSAMG